MPASMGASNRDRTGGAAGASARGARVRVLFGGGSGGSGTGNGAGNGGSMMSYLSVEPTGLPRGGGSWGSAPSEASTGEASIGGASTCVSSAASASSLTRISIVI